MIQEAPPNLDPRVYYAAQRTHLAWIRTGLAMMGFGFVVARFGIFLREIAFQHAGAAVGTGGLSLWFGTALILLGVIVHVVATVQYIRELRRLQRGEILIPRFATGLILAVILAILGLVMAGYLMTMGDHSSLSR